MKKISFREGWGHDIDLVGLVFNGADADFNAVMTPTRSSSYSDAHVVLSRRYVLNRPISGFAQPTSRQSKPRPTDNLTLSAHQIIVPHLFFLWPILHFLFSVR